MMKLNCILILAFLSAALAANCYGSASKQIVSEFDAFPAQVAAGDTLFIRANVNPAYNMSDASVRITVYYSEKADVRGLTPIMDIPALDFCKLSTTFTCPLLAGPNILNWEYTVPALLPGTYQVKYEITEHAPKDDDPHSCIQFPVTILGDKVTTYSSWYEATLIGSALFTEDDHTKRQLGEALQVGPAGPLNNTVIGGAQYGTIKFLKGSGDLVPNAYYDASNFVWGLTGVMTKQTTGSRGRMTHIYEGTCYLGYINKDKLLSQPTGNFYDYVTPLIEGTFFLNWTYTDSLTAQITGHAMFDSNATIPYGWGFPLVYGRLGQHQIVTSDSGFLQIKGSKPYCTTGVCKESPPGAGNKKSSWTRDKYGLAIGIPLGVIFVAVIVLGAFLYLKRRRETEQEDGIFAVARKPEYGSALVVDDIIEETRGSRALQAMMDIRDEMDQDSDDSDSMSERGRSRSRSAAGSDRYDSRARSRSPPAYGSESRASDSD